MKPGTRWVKLGAAGEAAMLYAHDWWLMMQLIDPFIPFAPLRLRTFAFPYPMALQR